MVIKVWSCRTKSFGKSLSLSPQNPCTRPKMWLFSSKSELRTFKVWQNYCFGAFYHENFEVIFISAAWLQLEAVKMYSTNFLENFETNHTFRSVNSKTGSFWMENPWVLVLFFEHFDAIFSEVWNGLSKFFVYFCRSGSRSGSVRISTPGDGADGNCSDEEYNGIFLIDSLPTVLWVWISTKN